MPMKAHVFPKKNFKFWLCYWIWTRAQKSSTSTRTHVDAKYAYHYIRYKPIILELLIVCTRLRQNCSFNPGIYHPAATLHYGLLWNKKKRKNISARLSGCFFFKVLKFSDVWLIYMIFQIVSLSRFFFLNSKWPIVLLD